MSGANEAQSFFNIDDASGIDWDEFGWFDGEVNSLDDLVDLAEEDHVTEVRQPRPELNGKLLINPAGTVFSVIDGVALGFISDAVFRRIHYRCYSRWSRPIPPGHAGVRTRVRICPKFHRVQSVDWITTGIMDPSCQLRRNPYEPGAVFLIRSGYKHGITSREAFKNYQFDYDDVGSVMLKAEWDELRDGVLLHETTGGRF